VKALLVGAYLSVCTALLGAVISNNVVFFTGFVVALVLCGIGCCVAGFRWARGDE
jgi:hypothetical protein